MARRFVTSMLACLLFASMATTAQAATEAPNYELKAITMADGLPHNYVDAMLRDSRGYMWFALAGGGVVRYDGYDFERFDPSTAGREISGHFVGCLQEDPWGRLWLGTDQGISVIDINSLRSTPLSDFDLNFCPVDAAAIKDMQFDSKGRLWICGIDNIWMLNFAEDGAPDTLYVLPVADHRLHAVVVRDVFADGTMCTAIDGEIVRMAFDPRSGITYAPINCKVDPRITVYDLMLYGSSVWLATDSGLYSWDTTFHDLTPYFHNDADPASISQNFVDNLTLSGDGRLVVATLNGINVYDDHTHSFNRIDLTRNNPAPSLSSNFVNCLLADGKNLWIGTEGGGVLLLKPSRALLAYHNFGTSRTSAKPVNAILEDSQHTLWVGLVEGGLAYKTKNDKDFTVLTTANSPVPHNSVSALAADPDDGLWVGTWGEGVVVLDRSNPTKQKLRLRLDAGGGNIRPFIGVLQYDALNHGMWIGTSVGLFFYDMQQECVVEPFVGAYDQVKGAIGAAIDAKQHLWLGSYEGLYDIDLTSRHGNSWSYRVLESKLDMPHSPLKERISSIFVTPEGVLWVGSSVNGLYCRQVNDGEETFVNYNIDSGLPHNSVRGILEDINGKIWVSTYNGLATFDPKIGIWEHITPSEQSSQFYWNAYRNTSDGHLLLGSSDGLVDIDARHVVDPDDSHRVHFTKMTIDGEPAAIVWDKKDDAGCQYAHINYNESNRTIFIEFSALDYAQDPTCSYFYRLKGFDKEWERLPRDRHYVVYTNLSPGSYELEVSYGRDVESVVRKASVLSLGVLPLFYHTWWFKVLIGILVLAIAYVLYRYKMASMKQQKEELELAVEERTKEINAQKQALEERTAQVQELTVDRLSFFTNITHEFRTPITLILGPLNRAIEANDNPKVGKQLQYIGRNANYLLSLVNQLMDFRKIESGKFELARRPGNFRQFLRDTVEGFEPLANDREISLTTITSMPDEDISFDKEAMRKLLHNFVSNALKYTPDGGAITVRAALLPEWCNMAGGVRKLYLSVADTGDGIDPADIEKIFDRFYQGKGNIKYPNMASSSGIGLYLCKNIVEAYGGELKVKNNHGAGCTFRVLLPLLSEETAEQAQQALPVVVVPSPEPVSNEKFTILVVEDNKDMREYIADVLGDKYQVLKAESAMEGLNVLQSETVDFIISDLMMPGMDGMEFAKKVKANLAISHIPIIMLTAKSSDMTRRESYETGVDDFISKPFDPQLLLARIENIMQNKKRYQRQFAIDYEVDKVEMPEDSRDKKFLSQVMDVVQNNYKNSYFEVGDFAEALGVSRSFLNKKLQSLIGQSASQLMKSYRMKLAYELILKNKENKQYTIQEIAYDVGFNDSKYFTKCFSKEFNLTPSELMSL